MIAYDTLCMLCSFMWPFGLCYAATMLNTASSSTTDILYGSNWYEFPQQLRSYVPMMLARSQTKIIFTGFGIVGCNLNKFLKVNI